MTPSQQYDIEEAQRRERRKAADIMRQRYAERVASDLATAERNAPIRAAFHALLAKEGFREHETPPPGNSYEGGHTQMLWEFYLAATLQERERCAEICSGIGDGNSWSDAHSCAEAIRRVS